MAKFLLLKEIFPAFTGVHHGSPAYTGVYRRSPAFTMVHRRTPAFTVVYCAIVVGSLENFIQAKVLVQIVPYLETKPSA